MQNHTERPDSTARPLGYWLRAVDALLAREFATAFEAEGVTRRDWRILNLLGGDVVAPELAERLQRRGGKKLAGLVERGWVAESDGEFTLTGAGRAAKDRLGQTVAGIRARVSGAVSEADFATTLASLQSIATELGWDPEERMPRGPRHRGHGRGRAFGPGRRGFGNGRPFGPRHGDSGFGRPPFGPDDHGGHGEPGIDHGCNHGHRSGHGRAHGHGHHHAERAYERGFAAGFDRGSAPREA